MQPLRKSPFGCFLWLEDGCAPLSGIGIINSRAAALSIVRVFKRQWNV
jgi:hypothetical protein